MKKSEGFDFDTWLDNLTVQIGERTGVDFKDGESVRQDYEDDKNMFDVADDICIDTHGRSTTDGYCRTHRIHFQRVLHRERRYE